MTGGGVAFAHKYGEFGGVLYETSRARVGYTFPIDLRLAARGRRIAADRKTAT